MFIPGTNSFITNPVANTSTSKGSVVVSSAAANTKGSWTSLFDPGEWGIAGQMYDGLLVTLSQPSAAGPYLVDLGYSVDGSTFSTVVDNLAVPYRAASAAAINYGLPLRLSGYANTGSGLYARSQCTVASGDITVSVVPLFGGLFGGPGGRMITYGAATGTSRGSTIDPGSVANTNGAWVQFSGNTTGHISSIAISLGSNADIARTGVPIQIAVDVGVGAASAEAVVISNYMVQMNTTTDFNPNQMCVAIPVSIPPASRVSVRARSNNAVAGDRTVDAILYCCQGGL